ncbi:MAG: helix-turn-helix domain-containing protein [Planctomycetota bacterium]
MAHTDLHDRLRSVAGERTYRRLGELTQTHPETVRRCMQGQAPSAEFLTRLCQVFGISGEWMLTGRGAMRVDDVGTQALRQANTPDLLHALADTVTALLERIERLEVFVQTLDTRLRVAGSTIEPRDGGSIGGNRSREHNLGDARVARRAQRIAGSIPERASPPAD